MWILRSCQNKETERVSQVIDNKGKHLSVIDNKTALLLKRKTKLVVDNKLRSFIVDNLLFLVCETVVDNYAIISVHCQQSLFPTQRQNECACSAFWRTSGHFLVSGYDQKAMITEKVPVLCSL